MSKKITEPEVPVIVPRCEYCKNNAGENKTFGHMWQCTKLGHCVPFGFKRIMSSGEYEYCEAIIKGKGAFELDEAKYKDYKLNNK